MFAALALIAITFISPQPPVCSQSAVCPQPPVGPQSAVCPQSAATVVEQPSGDAIIQEPVRGKRRMSKISMPTLFPEEPLIFDRVWARKRIDIDEVMSDTAHHSTLTLSLKELDPKGIRVIEWKSGAAEWDRQLVTGRPSDRAADLGVAELRTNVAYDLLISPKYRTLILENPEAAAVVAEAAVARGEAVIEKETFFYAEKSRAKSIVRSIFATPELLEYSLLEEPAILFQPLGRSFRMDEDRRWEDFFVNPVGVAPLPAMSILAPVRHHEESKQIEIRWTRELVPELADSIIEADLAEMRHRLKTNKKVDDLRSIFDIREEVRYLLDLETGLPIYAERQSYVRIGSDERTESVRFLRRGAELPAIAGEPWFGNPDGSED